MAVTKTKITRKDGKEVEVSVFAATHVAFEEEFDKALGELKRMKELYWVAWHAESEQLRTDGQVTKLFGDWLPDIAEVGEVEEGKGSSPTRKPRTPTS